MGSSSKIAPEWGREGSVMVETPPVVGGFLGVFPTQHLRVLGWAFSRRDGARHPDVRVFLSMELPSGGTMDIRVIFRGGDGNPLENHLRGHHHHRGDGDQPSEGRLAAR